MSHRLPPPLPFDNRPHAGRLPAGALQGYAGRGDVIVLALPRGGVPVGFEVANMLTVPLDLMLVRKLGTPGQEEVAMGAIATGGVRVLNSDVVDVLRISHEVIEAVARRELKELDRRQRAYRGDQPPPVLRDKRVILVDDGIATGATMRSAVKAARAQSPARIVVAAPIAAVEAVEMLEQEADEVVCLATPRLFKAVGCWYHEFPQTSDTEVKELLARSLLAS